MRVLATSRNPLHVRGERQYPVPPLALPRRRRQASLEVLSGYPAIALFVERSQAVNPSFALTAENVGAVMGICAKLDGLPLAIELVSAHMKLMTPKALLARLKKACAGSLRMLEGGSQDMPERHQTLRATIAWSYDLLDDEARALFRLLGVFEGGFMLEAVEALWEASAGEHGVDVLGVLAGLLDKNLVKTDEMGPHAESRFAMLETIRELRGGMFGRERRGGAREAMARYYLGVAEEAEPQLVGSEQKVWLGRLALDLDNFRAALTWASTVEDKSGDTTLRLAAALWRFWWMHEHISEGQEWLEKALAGGAAGLRCGPETLNGAGVLARNQCDYGRATALLNASLEQWAGLDNKRGIANSLNSLGLVALDEGDYGSAEPYFEQSLALERDLGDKQRVAISLNNLGGVALYKKNYLRAVTLFEESLYIRRELGMEQGDRQFAA